MRSVDHVKAVTHVDARPLFSGRRTSLRKLATRFGKCSSSRVTRSASSRLPTLVALDVHEHEVHVLILSLEQHVAEEVEEALPLLYDSNTSMNFDVGGRGLSHLGGGELL